MVVGQSGKLKVGAIIQARMQSTRLPGKILFPLPAGSETPLLHWPVEQLKSAKLIDKVIIATSVLSENDDLVRFAKQSGVECYRGDEVDVLSRYVDLTLKEDFDIVIRLTGDNPIIDISMLEEMVMIHSKDKCDYSYSCNLPLGMNFEIVSGKALLYLKSLSGLTAVHKEHVTLYFKENSGFNVLAYSFENIPDLRSIRLTVDYAADFCVLNFVFGVKISTGLNGFRLIEYVNEKYPWLWDVNKNCHQHSPFASGRPLV